MRDEEGSSSTSRRCKEDRKGALNLQACGRFSSEISPQRLSSKEVIGLYKPYYPILECQSDNWSHTKVPSTSGQFAFPPAPESGILGFLPNIEQ